MSLFRESETSINQWFEPTTDIAVPELTLPDLLEEAWKSLKKELDEHGSSRDFLNLRRSYGDKIKAWWHLARETHLLTAMQDSVIDFDGQRVTKIDDEEIRLIAAEDALTEDQIVVIEHKTPLTESRITVTKGDYGIDLFMHPPKVESKVREAVDGDWKTYWEVVYRSQGISTFSRTRIFDHPNHELPYVKDTEIIDASIFGADIAN